MIMICIDLNRKLWYKKIDFREISSLWDETAMIGQEVSHYKILDELGSGGMGVVYKAHDTKLNRTVALKFILPRISKKKGNYKRFIQEAQAAASLNHPHICTVYEIDDQGDSTFIAMEYVKGKSLREYVQKGPMGLEEALEIASQIADGMEEAHDKGIIHRDIKSSNIIVTEKNQAKIMDFGLAKVMRFTDLSDTKSVKGTVSYMSPEQAVGKSVDLRTDIWSFGVVLYEMLSARLPFESRHDQLVLYSILHEDPILLSDLRGDLPAALERIVRKCLNKDPDKRYQNTSSLKEDLLKLKQEMKKDRTLTFVKKKRIDKSPRMKRSILLAVLLTAALILAGGHSLFHWFGQSVQYKKSIAVLPFKGLIPEQSDEILCSYLTIGIINRLGELSPELRVVPYASVEKYKSPIDDISKIGHDLKIDYILSSKVQHEDRQVRIDAELISVKDERFIRPYSLEAELEDYSVIQDKMSQRVVEDLGVFLMESGLIAAKRRESEKFEASLLYQEGMDILDKSSQYTGPGEWFLSALDKFDKALQIDPDFALAYWGKGAVYEALYVETDQKDILLQMLDNFEKAHDLDPDLAETNLSLGWAHFHREDLNKSYRSFKKALELSPHNPLVITDAGSFLASMGLYRPAIALFSRAIRIEPSYLRAYLHKAICHCYIGEFAEGVKSVEKRYSIETEDPQVHLILARNLIMLDQFARAQIELDEAVKLGIKREDSYLKAYQALLWAKKGQNDRALELISDIDVFYLLPVSCIYTLLGMKDKAIESIEFGVTSGFDLEKRYMYTFPILENNPCYKNLHNDPRFIEILKQARKTHNQNMKRYGGL